MCAYYIGKKEGLTPNTLGQLGFSIGGGTKGSPLAPAQSNSVLPNAAGVAATSGSDACKTACDSTYNECIASGGNKGDCAMARNSCKSACGGGTTPGPGIDPCKQGCTTQHIACMNAALTPDAKAACRAAKANCDAQCDQTDVPPTPDECGAGYHKDPNTGECVPDLGPTGCQPGYHKDPATNKCVPDDTGTSCPTPTGEKIYPGTGCECGKFFQNKPGITTCPTGYVPVQKEGGVRCECQKWCVETGWGEDCVTKSGGDEGDMGAYDYPQWLKDLMARLTGRANTFLGMKPGYSDTALTNMFGLNYDKVRRAGTATGDATTAALADAGMLGTGAGTAALQANAQNTEKNVVDLKREVMTANEAQKRDDLKSFTESANTLFQAGLNFEQIREAINSGRRGESQTSLALLIQYLLGLAG